jgi:hypothetical protein
MAVTKIKDGVIDKEVRDFSQRVNMEVYKNRALMGCVDFAKHIEKTSVIARYCNETKEQRKAKKERVEYEFD